ncbi:alpha/beta hydrolase [Flavobacterium amnicola]|uniref:Alpha/beta hydrolase n=1 Tax=Flavobacterium amnicola TaxID=2506422 RepID=A0A4Q1K0B4_9FLAO|nr:alpha/beta hydrolase-fold protein [Flavobacterium amnicola]RXR17257.1 alpha/beta hydrolase [Flavobacterium amnicola]
MKKIIGFILLFCITTIQAQEKDFVLGKIATLKSTVLNEDRKLNIYFPAGYDATTSYPVIYLLDGSADQDFIHIVGIVQFANYDWINMLSKSIVVGIENVDRRRDFTFPTTIEKDKQDFPTTGGSEKFITFLEKELQPYIEQKYKTTASKTIIGQSLGGLLATEILFKMPRLFTNYIIVSPSIWWNKQSLFAVAPEFANTNFNQKTKVFISVGKEGSVMEKDAKKLYEMVKKNGKSIDSHFHYFNDSSHADILHLAVYKAFETLKI